MQMLPTRVIEVRYRCEDIVSVMLARPAGYGFSAGQWFRMSIETAEGDDVRTFSHAAAPADDWIEATTRLSGSAFKHALARLVGRRHGVDLAGWRAVAPCRGRGPARGARRRHGHHARA